MHAKLAGFVFRYATFVWGKNKSENATVEIMQCIENLINSYNSEKGNFVNYLSASLKSEISRANEKNARFEAENGANVSEKKRRRIRGAKKYAESKGLNLNNARDVQKIADALNITEKKLYELLLLEERKKAISLDAPINTSNDGNFSLIDTIGDERFSVEKNLFTDDEKVNGLLSVTEKVFENQQERTKSYLSSLITLELLNELCKIKNLSKDDIKQKLDGRNFCDKKLLCDFLRNEKIPSQQEIAKKFDRDKTDSSRAMKNFEDKLIKWLSYHIAT